MSRFSPRSITALCASGLAALAVALVPAITPGAGGDEPSPQPSLFAFTILSGMTLSHTFTVSGTTTTKSEPLTKPDDITNLGDLIFVGFQNGVGPQGEPNSLGNTDGTIVAMSRFGQAVAQWDVQGKVDGLTADPEIGGLIATVNEDANSSLYTITPGDHGAATIRHYAYNEPLPHNGGTDAISVDKGRILISASAPGTTGTLAAPQPTFPAVYDVTLDPSTSIADVTPYFYDEDNAALSNAGPQGTTTLQLTDPDSSSVVPKDAPRFGGDFMLTSQGDLEQIFVGNKENPRTSLSVLSLTQAVDDTAWADGPGILYATDSSNDAVDALGGTFGTNPIVAVTPCGANTVPNSCSANPPLPLNYLGSLNPWTGAITSVPVAGAAFVPQGGLLFLPFSHPDHDR